MLSSVKHKCEYIGLKLGVSRPTIQSITKQHAAHLDQLCEILEYRLKQVPRLTLHDISQALGSTIVEESLMASEIQPQNMSALVSSQVRTEPLILPFSTVTQSTATPGPPTCALTSETASSRLGKEPVACSMPNIQQAAYLPAQTPCQISSQPLATPTNRMYQHYTGQWPPHRHGILPPYIPQYPVPYPGAWLGMNNPYMCPVPPQQPYYHHPNPYSSALLQPSAEQYTVSTTQSTTTVNISTDNHMQPDTSHQPFSRDNPHFSLCTTTVQQVGQAPSNFRGKTTHDHLHQASHEQVSQCQSPQQDISDHVSQMESNDTSRADFDCDTPPAKKVHLETPMDQFIRYIKQTYRLSVIERRLNVIKWPPTPSKIFINLACIDWKTVVTQAEADEFTRAMVEDGNVDVIMKKKTPIDFGDIVRDLPATALEKVILVEGAPGVGKSTFAWEFCRRWERGEIAQQYKLVLLLRLRDEGLGKARSLKDLLYHPSSKVGDAVEEDLIATLGVQSLFILEGFDELPDTLRMDVKSSVFLQLIYGQLLPLATILVTSRSWAATTLLDMCHHRVFQHIEILGFTEHHIEQYIRSVFQDEDKSENAMAKEKDIERERKKKKDIEDIMTYIATYPQIKACMYIPLNSAIVVSVYQESKAGGCDLPKTLTELYYTLTQVLLLRYLRGHAAYCKKVWNIQSLKNDLPEDVYEQLLKISEIAYSGICTDWGKSVKLIYSDLPPAFETLGLMQSVSQMYVRGVNMSHNFLHLTVQEFLAALHISNMSPEEQLEHFQRHKEGRFRVVLRFLAGLTKLDNISIEQRRGFLEPLNSAAKDMDYTQMISDVSVCAHHLNWMFETQSSDVIKTWLQDKTVDFKFQAQMSPLECYSAGYCIAHSSAQWVLTIEEDMEENAVKMFCTGASSAEEDDFKTKLRVVANVATEKLTVLLTHLGPHIQELHLRIYDSNLSFKNLLGLQVLQLDLHCKTTFNLTTSFPPQSLESLTIKAGSGSNVLGQKTCAAIGELLSSARVLKHLHFTSAKAKGLKIGSKGMKVIIKAMASNNFLPLKCLNIVGLKQDGILKELANNSSIPLKRLKIITLEISDTAADSLALFIHKCATLEFVSWEVEDTTLITACGLREMANAQQHYSWLPPAATRRGHHCVLNCTEDGIDFDCIWQHHSFHGALTCHNIDDEGAGSFGPSLIKNSTVRRLYFNSNHAHPVLTKVLHHGRHHLTNKKISDAGVTTLAQALHHNSTLQQLDLSNNTVSDAGATAIAQALHHNSTLQQLDLSNNSITDAGVTAIAQALHHNSTLRELDLSNNSVSDAGVTTVAQALHHNSTLRELDLSNNSPSDAGVTAVVQALHHNSTLQKLNLSNNSVSDAGVTAVAQALHHNSTLQKLNLSNNSVSDAGVTAVAQALHHNSTLQELDLSNNSITDAGVTAIAQALHHNSTLQRLNLSNNSVSDAGVTAVAQALHQNSTLWKLDLSNNSVSDAGVTAIAQALHHSSTLLQLDLSNNSVSDAGATAVAQALHHNSRLGGLNLSGNDAIYEDSTRELVHALTVNTCGETWLRYCGGLVLPKRCEEFATQCPKYVKVKTSIKFV